MKKQLKRILSIILCFAILVPCAVITVGAEAPGEKQSAADYPLVFVTGIGQSYSYYYQNPEDAKLDVAENSVERANARWNLFCNDFSFAFKEFQTYASILSVAAGLIGTLILGKCVINRNSVDKLVKILFRYNTIDENGKLPENIVTPRADCSVADMTKEQRDNFYRTIPCQEVVGDVGEDMLYCFNYSAFSFTFDNSDALKKFIDTVVLPQTGAEKVVLIPMSMGASVVSAYLHDYGSEGKVARVVSIVGAWLGSDILADLIELKYADDSPEKFYNGVIADLIGEPWGYVVNIALRLFRKSAGREMVDRILDSIVCNLVMRTPSLCGLVPPERYPAIRASRLEGKDDYKYIMEQTDRYYEVQRSLKTTVDTLSSQGVEFYYIAGYGLGFGDVSSDYEFFKFMQTANSTNSDEIIQITSTATGATAAKAGSQLDAAYIASHDSEYISPDKSVDLSTCYFPDNVWLFSNQKHELENNNTALKLAFELACGKIKSSNDCPERFPRFNDSRDLKKLNRSYIPDMFAFIAPKAASEKLDGEQKTTVTNFYNALTDLSKANSALSNAKKSQVEKLTAEKENAEKAYKTSEQALAKLMTEWGIYESYDPDKISSDIREDLNNYLGKKYVKDYLTAEQYAKYEAVLAMKEKTINNREADDKVIADFYDMLVSIGVYSAPEEPGKFDTALNNGLKKANDTVYSICGPMGFLDAFLALFKK